jgi:hypothetical protein
MTAKSKSTAKRHAAAEDSGERKRRQSERQSEERHEPEQQQEPEPPHGSPICGVLARVVASEEECRTHGYFMTGETVLILGGIAQKPGHCAVATKDGAVRFSLPSEHFEPLAEEIPARSDRGRQV